MASTTIETPIGRLFAGTTAQGLRHLEFGSGKALSQAEIDDSAAAQSLLALTVDQLGEYFEGVRQEFDLPLDLTGTPFRRRVWQAIASIPYGETISYAALALSVGSPGAYRAAGSACGANPLVLIVPCHRIVGSDGSLHGFGGGLGIKSWLLNHEKASLGSMAKTPQLALV